MIVWDTTTGKEIRKYVEKNPCTAVAHSPDGKFLALGDWEGNVILRDEATGKELRRFKACRHPVACLVFTPDGTTLAAGAMLLGGSPLGYGDGPRAARVE